MPTKTAPDIVDMLNALKSVDSSTGQMPAATTLQQLLAHSLRLSGTPAMAP